MNKRPALLILPLLFLSILMYGQTAQIGGTINRYAAVFAYDPCTNSFTVGNFQASAFKAGDTVYIMQMKGAIIDSSNSANFGTVTNYANAGNYELNYVSQVSGNNIQLKNALQRTYSIPDGKVQLVRVPYYRSANVISPLTCIDWDSQKGGVIAMIVGDTLRLNAPINATGRGFIGGIGFNTQTNALNCFSNNYFYDVLSPVAASKGESIAHITYNIISGKGPSAGAGGGGMDHNSGGGGGGNGGRGGFGGYQWQECGMAPFDNRGIGGNVLSYNTTINKAFLGSGGGAGHMNNAGNFNTHGADGGGLILISANYLVSNSNRIISDGNGAAGCSRTPTADCHDGMAGGGAGGTVLLDVNNFVDPTIIQTNGGKGGDMTGPAIVSGRIGPGGGGGGGVLWLKSGSLPANVTHVTSGGGNGGITELSNEPWGATGGQPGFHLFNLKIEIDTSMFYKNIDSVRIKDSLSACATFDFRGLEFVRLNSINNWQWSFGDGNNGSAQNISHNYLNSGNYQVQLIATDINGCKDSSTVSVVVFPKPILTVSDDTTICKNSSIRLAASGGTSYLWSPAQTLSDASIPNPVASPIVNTTYLVTTSDTNKCSVIDSVKVGVRPIPTFTLNGNNKICYGNTIQLNASGGDNYLWSPAHSLNSSIVANPIANPDTTTLYAVYISETNCNYDTTLNLRITVDPTPIVQAQKSNDIDCGSPTAQLNATGASSFLWTPSTGLNNPTIANPLAGISATTTYIVTGTNNFGCKNSDTLTVNVTNANKPTFVLPNAFTPNGDRINQCFGIQRWGNVTIKEFSIYNRWGQRVFSTKDPTKCWDGTINGKPQATGAYAYVINASSFCGEIVHKGLVMLIR